MSGIATDERSRPVSWSLLSEEPEAGGDETPRGTAPRGRRRAPGGTGVARGILRGLGWSVIVFVGLIIVAGGILPRVLGAVPLTVLSGSMEPAFSPGDLVISQPVDPRTLATGDVITFQPVSDDPTLVTHRVIGFTFGGGESRIITRGDANGASDAPIVYDQVMGKVLYSLPYLGYVSQAVTSVGAAWLIPLVGVALLVYAMTPLVGALRRTRRARSGSREEDG